MRSRHDFLKITPQKNATLQIRITSDDLFQKSINTAQRRLLKERNWQNPTYRIFFAELEGY